MLFVSLSLANCSKTGLCTRLLTLYLPYLTYLPHQRPIFLSSVPVNCLPLFAVFTTMHPIKSRSLLRNIFSPFCIIIGFWSTDFRFWFLISYLLRSYTISNLSLLFCPPPSTISSHVPSSVSDEESDNAAEIKAICKLNNPEHAVRKRVS